MAALRYDNFKSALSLVVILFLIKAFIIPAGLDLKLGLNLRGDLEIILSSCCKGDAGNASGASSRQYFEPRHDDCADVMVGCGFIKAASLFSETAKNSLLQNYYNARKSQKYFRTPACVNHRGDSSFMETIIPAAFRIKLLETTSLLL